ncbi:hypothetical protein HJC23_008209 [Cyclotella cryptica]|uniref:Uncharacterized protein n=1 Tax=Cyclotella cryptica TaxID=29204 RepID=A0ABD3P0E2_9STRA
MSLVQWLYTDPDAASGFIKKLLEKACGLRIQKVSTCGCYEVLFYPSKFAMGFNMPSELVSKTYVHAASAILSDTTTTPGEATFITDAIKAFNKARDNEIASPQTKYENFNNAPIPNAIDPVAPVQNHIMFQVMQTNIVRPRRSSVRNNTC